MSRVLDIRNIPSSSIVLNMTQRTLRVTIKFRISEVFRQVTGIRYISFVISSAIVRVLGTVRLVG